MADDVEMTPVEMTPVDAAEPPKADPLAASAAPKVATIKLNPVVRKPVLGGAPTAALKPGLKLPPKPGMAAGLKLPPKPGLKLPTVGLKPGIKLPPKPVIHKPGATVVAAPLPKPVEAPVAELKPVEAVSVAAPAENLKPAEPVAATPAVPAAPAGLKLPPKPGLKLPTVGLKPGIKLPPKPVIRKPGATVTAMPLPKPVTPLAAVKPAEPAAAPSVAAASAPVTVASAASPVVKPVAVDAQGIGKLPTVEAKAVDRNDTAPAVNATPNPLEALKSVTQKLKGITQEIPQQAILRKTGIIAEGAMSEAQKEASKHKTARISLSDAMGVAPVKNENAPMKTIRIKRPIDISGATKTVSPAPVSEVAAGADAPAETAPTAVAGEPAPTVTQRKTLKISRPGGAIRPSGKFGIKRPGSQATTIVKAPAAASGESAEPTNGGEVPVAEIADIPEMPTPASPAVATSVSEGPAWLLTLSTLVQAAACVAIGALAWLLYQNTQIVYF